MNDDSKTLGDSEMSQFISENNSPLLDDDEDEDNKIQIKETKEVSNDINEETGENLETVQVIIFKFFPILILEFAY